MHNLSPLSEDLRLAAEWLDVNEGTEGESDSCKRVADWLRRKAERMEFEQAVLKVVKETGCTPLRARMALTSKTMAASGGSK